MLLYPGTRTSRKEPDIATWTLSVWNLSRDGLMLLVMLVFVMADRQVQTTGTCGADKPFISLSLKNSHIRLC